MDPVTGLTALAGISLATVAGLRLKKQMNAEGFVALPDTNTNYQESVKESQTRYNMFSGLINPITNSVIPVGSSSNTVKRQTELVNDSLGSYNAVFSPQSSQTLVLQKFENQFKPRADSTKSLYGAMKFCREAAQQTNPFTTYNSDGSVKLQGAVSADGELKFDEVCGVCLTNGIDEEGTIFNKPRGMLVESGAREEALAKQKENGWAYPRIKPSIGTCEGSPGSPVFAVTAKDLALFRNRLACLENKEVGGSENCALCFESDEVYSSVGPTAQTNPISFKLQGIGSAKLLLRGTTLQTTTLSDTTPTVFELGTSAKEGDTFVLDISPPANSTTPVSVYGYMYANTPKQGLYTMPLNLLVTVDDETGGSPTKSEFPTFEDVGLTVAKMVPGPGKTRMRLRGVIPFTFVQASEFAAMDCLDGPYQTQGASASAFSTDQPCFARGSKPGNYNDACLRQRILDAGCTNAGELYVNPQQLNTSNGAPQSLTRIYAALKNVAALDMVDPEKTKQCSGRSIETPCDPFLFNTSAKFGAAMSSGGLRANQAQQCLSFLYHNRGANERSNPARVGPTYTGLVTYRNNQREIKNIYCLPEGALNPDTNSSARDTLARIGDNGYKGKASVDAIKLYLNDQLTLATDTTRNANSDPDRKAAITNCFGTNLTSLPAALSTNPRVVNDSPPPGFTSGLYVRFFEISDQNPDIVPGNRGWGNSIGTPRAYTSIQFNDRTLARSDRCGVVAKGYYFATGPETLHLYTVSDDGIFVSFNNVQRISNWRIKAPTGDMSAPIQIPAAGMYPFELRFYEWAGGAACNFFYRLNNETNWRSDLSERFFYKTEDVERENQALLALQRGQFTAASLTPRFNTRVGTVQINGDYTLSMTIRPTGLLGDWASIIRFSLRDGNCCEVGQRAPGIWFFPGQTRLHVIVGDTQNGNWGVNTAAGIPMNSNTTFRLDCIGSSVVLTVNNEVIRVTQPSRRATGLANIFVGDAFYQPAKCQITNLSFRSLN